MKAQVQPTGLDSAAQRPAIGPDLSGLVAPRTFWASQVRSAGASQRASAGLSGNQASAKRPSKIAGSPSTRNMKRQPAMPRGLATSSSQPESGAPMTWLSEIAVIGMARIVAR